MIWLNDFLTLCHLANIQGVVREMYTVVVVEGFVGGFSLAHQCEVFLCAGSSEVLTLWEGVFCCWFGWGGVGVVGSTRQLRSIWVGISKGSPEPVVGHRIFSAFPWNRFQSFLELHIFLVLLWWSPSYVAFRVLWGYTRRAGAKKKEIERDIVWLN